jgi:hypothetical protein
VKPLDYVVSIGAMLAGIGALAWITSPWALTLVFPLIVAALWLERA